MSGAVHACRACGARNRPGWRNCQRCGAVLGPAPPGTPAGAGAQANWPLVGWAVVAVVAISAGVWLPGRGGPGSRAVAPAGAASDASPTPRVAAAALTGAVVAPDPAAVALERGRQGALAYGRGDMAAALAAFEEAVAAAPGDAEAANNLGQVLTRLGRTTEALPLFERAITLAPDKWAYRFNRARALGLTGDWDGAVEGYLEADRLFPDDHVTLYNLALAMQKTGMHAEAAERLERVVELDTSDPSYLLPLGTSYEALGRGGDAARIYAQYLEVSPDSAEAPAVRARLARLTGGATGP
ncbi:MAG TPA: tetratricopeptide repeat protein [Methylomirabilota bacterium]